MFFSFNTERNKFYTDPTLATLYLCFTFMSRLQSEKTAQYTFSQLLAVKGRK